MWISSMLMQGSSGCPADIDPCPLKRLQMSCSARQYATPCDTLHNILKSLEHLSLYCTVLSLKYGYRACEYPTQLANVPLLVGLSTAVSVHARCEVLRAFPAMIIKRPSCLPARLADNSCYVMQHLLHMVMICLYRHTSGGSGIEAASPFQALKLSLRSTSLVAQGPAGVSAELHVYKPKQVSALNCLWHDWTLAKQLLTLLQMLSTILTAQS